MYGFCRYRMERGNTGFSLYSARAVAGIKLLQSEWELLKINFDSGRVHYFLCCGEQWNNKTACSMGLTCSSALVLVDGNEIGTHPTPLLTQYAVLLALVHEVRGRGCREENGMVPTVLPNTKMQTWQHNYPSTRHYRTCGSRCIVPHVLKLEIWRWRGVSFKGPAFYATKKKEPEPLSCEVRRTHTGSGHFRENKITCPFTGKTPGFLSVLAQCFSSFMFVPLPPSLDSVTYEKLFLHF
jgi:hypothetical protein